MSNFDIDLKVQRAKDIPLEKVSVKKQIDLLTAQAWISQSKQLEDKVAKMSVHFGFPSEYTHMILLQTVGGKRAVQSIDIQKILNKVDLQKLVESKDRKITFMKGTGIGFGNLVSTADNVPPKIRGIPIARACGGSLCKGSFELLQ
ncbi:hypothetical protein IFM89_029280 [Coptis chinensis]|uniref:Uncharacterized protein n=1 Tax=Coptis chinensis TaxID=261450 RepID=A0A835I0J4_9MAGN|nr:hypothetical protein IFM89_029280 [Coptis chinensis]